MKTSTILRCTDLTGQLLMMHPLCSDAMSFSFALLLTMMYLGGWQVLSFLVHCLLSAGGRQRRRSYAFALAVTGIILLLFAATAIDPHTGILHVLTMLCCSMGVWYFGIGIAELRVLHLAQRHRREIHWKL